MQRNKVTNSNEVIWHCFLMLCASTYLVCLWAKLTSKHLAGHDAVSMPDVAMPSTMFIIEGLQDIYHKGTALNRWYARQHIAHQQRSKQTAFRYITYQYTQQPRTGLHQICQILLHSYAERKCPALLAFKLNSGNFCCSSCSQVAKDVHTTSRLLLSHYKNICFGAGDDGETQNTGCAQHTLQHMRLRLK